MARILIVEDHPIFRRGLKEVLTSSARFADVGEVSDAREAQRRIKEEHWDAVVLDIHLPGKSGLELLKDLKRDRPRLPLLVVSAYPEDQYAVRTLKAGASGYMTKDRTPDELVNALKKLLQGRKYIKRFPRGKTRRTSGRRTEAATRKPLRSRI